MTTKECAYSWPALLTQPVAWDRYKVVELVTPNALIDHAMQMENCVMNYTDACIADEDPMHVLAVLDEKGNHVAVNTVMEKTESKGMESSILLGRRNAILDNLEIEAIWIAACKEMKKNLSVDAIEQRKSLRTQARKDKRESWARMIEASPVCA